MKWNKYRVLLVLLIAITVWFTASKIKEASFIKNEYSTVSVRYGTGGVNEQIISNALKNEKLQGNSDIPEVTAWFWIKEAEIKNRNFNRTQKVSVVITSGNMALTTPMKLVRGNYVYRQDKVGCVIDTNTAYLLFGTEFAVGNTVTYDKKDYVIRGVVRADYPVFLIQGSGDKMEYSNLELGFMDKERGETLAEEFLLGNGPTGNYVIIDGYFYGRIIYSLISLPVWLFFFFGGYEIFKIFYSYMNKQKPGHFILYSSILLLILAGYGFILFRITGNPLYIPEKLIPTKWSDFDYWSKQYQLIQNQILKIRYLTPNPKDVYLVDKISNLLLNIIVMFLLYMFIITDIHILRLKGKSKNN